MTAGEGKAIFQGGDANETMYAGTGEASLYGGGGRNLLANTSTDKEGGTTFFVLGDADGARNTISGFVALSTDPDNDNSDVADNIEINTGANVVSNVLIRNDDDVVIEVTGNTGGTEMALIEDVVGQDIKFSGYVAQVNRTDLNYDGTANYFVATDKDAQITVGEDVETPAIIWLDNPGRDGSVYIGDIRTIDASDAIVKAELAGNSADNVIMAGANDASLWGGNGGDDLLVGGEGQNTFFYANGNGNDTASSVNDGDIFYLSGVTLEQISTATFEDGNAVINFTDGGKLTIDDAESKKDVSVIVGASGQTYKIEDGGYQIQE